MKGGGVKGIVEVKETIYTTAKQLSRHTSYQDGTQKYTPSFLGWIQTGELEKGGGFNRVFLASTLGSRLNGILGTSSEKGGDLTACY